MPNTLDTLVVDTLKVLGPKPKDQYIRDHMDRYKQESKKKGK